MQSFSFPLALAPSLRVAFAAVCLTVAGQATATLSSDEIAKLCANAEDSNDCGRRIEAVVLKKLPDNLARREGDVLIVQRSLSTAADTPNNGTAVVSGTNLRVEIPDAAPGHAPAPRNHDTATKQEAPLRFTDQPDAVHDITYTLWDYLPATDAVILYVNENTNAHFLWVARANGKTVSLPAEPVLSADSKQLATADFCTEGCTNEVAVWALDNGLPNKKLTWAPTDTWIDADVTWSSNSTVLNISYQKKGSTQNAQLTRTLNASDWRKATAGKP